MELYPYVDYMKYLLPGSIALSMRENDFECFDNTRVKSTGTMFPISVAPIANARSRLTGPPVSMDHFPNCASSAAIDKKR